MTGQTHPLAASIRVVLVEPSDPLNVGMVVRALSNLGFHQLHLVRPRNYERHRAKITACHGEYLLDQIQIHEELSAAIAPVEDVVGFEPKTGRSAIVHYELNEWRAELAKLPNRATALVFGSEDEGLSKREVEQCRALVSLPTYGHNYSYNLAQSVLLGLFTIAEGNNVELPPKQDPLPLWAEFQQLDKLMNEMLCRSGFYSATVSPETPAIMKSIFRRAAPSKREVQILLGVFSQANRALRGDAQIRRLAGDREVPRFSFPADAIIMKREEEPS